MARDREQAGFKVDRRSFLAASAVGAVAATAVSGSIARAASPEREVGGLALAGQAIGGGWRVSEVQPAEAGAIRIVASPDGGARAAHVLVCRAESGSGALATTGQVDLFLLNNGAEGQRLTPDDEVAMVKRLASRLAGREAGLPGYQRLMANRERLARFSPIDHPDPLHP